jgi:hypothetical protein
MNSGAPAEGPETDRPESFGAERRRAAVALAVIALAAVALVAIMLYVLGSGGHSGGPPPTIAGTGPAVVATGGQPATHSSSRPKSTQPTRPTPTSSTSTSSVVAHRTPTCPTTAPCPVPGDVGGAVAAVNAYRASHGVAPVRGTVTRSAQACAVSSGNTCPSHYFWEPVGRSGRQVVRKIAASGGKGVSFLLDKSTHVIEVGWAYLPRSHSYECAIVVKS